MITKLTKKTVKIVRISLNRPGFCFVLLVFNNTHTHTQVQSEGGETAGCRQAGRHTPAFSAVDMASQLVKKTLLSSQAFKTVE